jgi:hypothetical protein
MFKLRAADLFRSTWRSVLATAVMALVVVTEGVGWAPASTGSVQNLRDLMLAVTSGAATYCLVLLAAWRLSGRPDGAESMLLGIVQDTWRDVAGRMPWRKS